ncbi:MAG: ATP-binding protein, partial [Bifidobacteriales bacterium]|nr:ATP-binding protein [Bifidobacteriales bacterium]
VLRNTDAFQQRSKLIKVRRLATQFPGGATPDAYLTKEAFDYLSPHSSIVLPYTRTALAQVIARIGPETYFPIVPVDTIADPVLHVFDDSIDYFHIDQEHRAHLRFAGTSQEVVMSNMDTAGLLSLGTVRGSRIIKAAIRVLRTGGYLLIDEIENSINKELVRMIINLFMSTTSNPHGATLAFTTHYAELLDLIQRKDNIYFLRRGEDERKGIEAINYSEA